MNATSRVRQILALFNISINDEGNNQLDFIYDLELEKLLNYLNREDLPRQLENTLAYRIVGRFLKDSLLLNKYADLTSLTPDDLLTVTEIKEYETTIKHDKDSVLVGEKDRLLKLLDELANYSNAGELARHRRLIWE